MPRRQLLITYCDQCGQVLVRTPTGATAQRLAEAMLDYLHVGKYLPSHAARKRASLLALEIVWGLPATGWQLSAADVWAWYYRRVSGSEVRRRMAQCD